MQREVEPNTVPPMPDPEKLKPEGLSDRQKRWIFFGVASVILFIILANLIGANSPGPTKPTDRTAKAQQQNPTPAQIRDWEKQPKADRSAASGRAQPPTAKSECSE